MDTKTIARLDKETEDERKRVDELMKLPLWWGYLHVNGVVHAKRFFDNQDLKEAHDSPFVQAVCTPIPCINHEAALTVFHDKFGIREVEEDEPYENPMDIMNVGIREDIDVELIPDCDSREDFIQLRSLERTIENFEKGEYGY